jgi:hypothetical protein
VATWTLDVRDRIGSSLLKSDVAFRALTAKWVLNGAGSLEVELRHDADLGGARCGEAELQLKRDGTVVWAGPWLSTDVDPEGRSMRITCEGLWWWFRRRVVTSDLYYADTAQHTIAWNLLDHAQGQTYGSLGITNGSHTGTPKTRTRYYCAANVPNVAEEVEALTTYEGGFDFTIDPAARTFNTWTPSRMSSSGVALSGANVDELRWSEDMRDVSTFVTAVGANECGSILITSSDTTLANTYGRLHSAIDADDDDDTRGEVTELANETLRARKRRRLDASVAFREGGTGAPAWSSLVPGNTLTLADSRGYSTFGPTTLRIVEVGVSLDNGLPGQPIFTLELAAGVAA